MEQFKGFKYQQLKWRAVELICKHLSGSVNARTLLGDKADFDIRWREIDIDVRVARLKQNKWIFTIDKPNCHADIVILIALNKELKIFVVPIEILPETSVALRKRDGETRYDIFQAKLDNLPKSILEAKNKIKGIVQLAQK